MELKVRTQHEWSLAFTMIFQQKVQNRYQIQVISIAVKKDYVEV